MTKSPTAATAAAFYETALSAAESGCCASANAFTGAAGYTDAETDSVGSSFGCGNPLAFAGVKSGQTVLDLGCGAGIDLLIAAAKVGANGTVIGVDVSETMLDRARANVARLGFNNVELRRGLIEDLPVETSTVDWAISNCVINLSPDKQQVFGEIHRVLKPGGRLLVSDMIAEGLPDWIAQDAGLHGACITGAVSERDYLAAVYGAGLTEVTVVDRFTYDDHQLRALLVDLLPAALSSLSSSRGASKEGVLEETIAAINGRVQSLRISAARPI